MKRREFLKITGLSAATIALSSCPLFNSASKKKNVLVIVSDDHANKTIRAFSGMKINTPNLDEMATHGVSFTNAYSNAPICSASRQSLLTGKYPHATGVNLLFTPFNDTANYTIAEHLKAKGYDTGIIGKTHWNSWIWWKYYDEGGGFPDFGFDYQVGKQDHRDHLKKHPPEPVSDSIKTHDQIKNHNTVEYKWNSSYLSQKEHLADSEGKFFSDKAVEFMTSTRKKPFFLWLAYHEPHAPFKFPVEYRNKYKLDDIILLKGSPEDDRHIPEIFRGLSDKEKKGIIASYMSSVEYMDTCIGRVFAGLKKHNLEKDTLVMYISDHGYLLYDHKRFEKHTMWEESVKAPIIVQGFEKNVKTNALVEFIDVAPTICEAVGVKSPKSFQGKSILPILTGQTARVKEYVFSEFLEDNKAMVATQDWKYVFTTGKRDLGLQYKTGYGPLGVTEKLYDLREDPKEHRDVSHKPENALQLEKLRNKMLEIFMQTHPDADNCPEKLNTIGKLIWFCEPRDVGAEPGLPLQRIFEKD
ncbi:MAG: sulfatase [Fidelibacterota bacterium]